MHDEVHVWLARTAEVTDADAAAAQELLSAGERERQQHLRNEEHRRDFAVKRALVRLVLSRYADVDPRAWTFGTIDNGRPCIALAGVGDLDFNVSDTRGLVALLIARGARAAIDVEHLDRGVNVERMARRFFSPAEQEAFFGLDESRRHRRFFELWTAKEAYVKALGAGFAQSFRGFTISFDPLHAGDGWSLQPLDLGSDHAGTVAIRGEPRRIVVRSASPLAGNDW